MAVVLREVSQSETHDTPRILHLSTFDSGGGAARAAYELHTELGRLGAHSRMLVGRKRSRDSSVIQAHDPVTGMIRGRLDALPLRSYRKTAESFWTVGWQSSGVPRMVDELAPDIVHIHWTGAGFLSIEALARMNRPVIWTMHDMWAFTGGCHYAGACERYRIDCGRCPQLSSSREDDLSRRIRLQKRALWKDVDLRMVAISNWLGNRARESGLFNWRPIPVIPDGVDIHRFSPGDDDEKAARLRALSGRHRILFGSINPQSDPRKGFALFVKAAQLLAERGWADRAEIVVFGCRALSEMPELPMPVRFAGHISDDTTLAELYRTSDVMVVPSLQEAFGITVIEAMACGTPVVAFATGGPADIIMHRETGYLAEPFSTRSLAAGIAWCLEDPARLRALGKQARLRVQEHFTLSTVARRYLDLYETVWKERRARTG